MSKSRGKLWRSPSTLRIRLSRHLAIQYLIHAAIYMVLVIVWLYWYMNNLWDRIGPYSGGRIELPRIALFLIGFGLPVVIWFLYTIRFLQKPLRYLDDLLDATAQLATDKEKPIVLPAVMKEAENELNEVRLQSILDERRILENEEKKNDLIMYLAHDLKTPLTSVMGYLALLEENPDLSPEQRARYIGIARAKAERLEELIGEFFDIIAERNQSGVTVFLSSHILSEVQRNCSRAAVIREGRIIACDSVEALAKSNARRISLVGSADLTGLDGIRDMTRSDNAVSFLYSGDMNRLLHRLSEGDIHDLSVSEPDLEEIFLHYYEKAGADE